jgi:ribosome-binding factor A
MEAGARRRAEEDAMTGAPGPKRRHQRLNEQIRKEVADLLMRHTKDPRLATMVSVTHVEVSRDLANATINVSIMGTEQEKRDAMRALNGASGYLRRELGARIHVRQTPDLHFKRDDSIEEGARVYQLLTDVLPPDAAPEAGAAPEAASGEGRPPA